MTRHTRSLVIAAAAFFVGAVGWNSFVWNKQSQLSDMSTPFFAACQTEAGCILAPEGWEHNGEGSYENGLYQYAATREAFTLRQHFVTDIWLVAEGGKGKPVQTHRVVE